MILGSHKLIIYGLHSLGTIMHNCYRHCKKRVANATTFWCSIKKLPTSLFFP